GNRHGAVARQPFAPVDETDAERLPDEQRAEARAVDEQIAFDAAAVLEPDRGDETAFGVLLDLDDAPFGTRGAPLLGVAAQEARIAAGVELECIADLGQ